MIRAGIVGGAGYTAGELLRILLYHPDVNVTFVQSSSNAGKPVTAVHDDLLGETSLVFSEEVHFSDADVLFLCMGHGLSKKFMDAEHVPPGIGVIDLSTDYRLSSEGNQFIYGLPEINRDQIKTAKRVANPGCFATGIQLALLPLAYRHLLTDGVHVNAITGSTGAGQKPVPTTHFSWRSNNLSAYKMFEHQHEDEILQTLKQLQPGFDKEFNFIPVRGDFTRGIFVTAYTRFAGSLDEAGKIYNDYYQSHPFIVISDTNPGLKQVINTNKAVLYLEKKKDKLIIISLIDNLIKGASGQAVQNMNLMFGINEKAGLNLKPVAF
jgi:N-acetyl-gamma-glutamyl-phosphate reductase